MASEWGVRRLGDLAEVYDGPHATPAKTTTGPIFLGISNLVGGRLNLSETEHLSEEDFVRWTRRVTPQAGDVVFSYETRLGEAALIQQGLRCCLGRRMGILRPRNNLVDSRFLLYAYLGVEFQETLRARTIHGSTVDRIPLIDMPDFPIRVPSIEVQVAIANILGALDDKIKLNGRMSETLESMARGLFKSWFVDFDPVRAKAEDSERAFPQCIAHLFPDSLASIEDRETAKGWKVVGLDEIGRFLNGLALQKFPPQADRFLPVIKIAQLRTEDTSDADKASADLAPEYIVEDGDVLFSWSGSLECVLWAGGKGALNQHLFKVTSDIYPKWFYYLWIHAHLPEFRRIASGKATTMGHIQRGHLSAAKVLVPPPDLFREMDRFFAPLIGQIVNLKLASRTLGTIRDTLLPKLVSGELRIPDVERIVGGQL